MICTVLFGIFHEYTINDEITEVEDVDNTLITWDDYHHIFDINLYYPLEPAPSSSTQGVSKTTNLHSTSTDSTSSLPDVRETSTALEVTGAATVTPILVPTSRSAVAGLSSPTSTQNSGSTAAEHQSSTEIYTTNTDTISAGTSIVTHVAPIETRSSEEVTSSYKTTYDNYTSGYTLGLTTEPGNSKDINDPPGNTSRESTVLGKTF